MTVTGNRMRARFWIANAMSLIRFPLAAAVWVAADDVIWVIGLFVIAGITDILDGRIARWAGSSPGIDERRREAQARLGAWLDPLCDKAFMVSSALALFVAFAPPAHLMLLVVSRELLLLVLIPVYLRMPEGWRRVHPLTADGLGKVTTGLQAAAFAALLLWRDGFQGMAWAAGIGCVRTFVYGSAVL